MSDRTKERIRQYAELAESGQTFTGQLVADAAFADPEAPAKAFAAMGVSAGLLRRPGLPGAAALPPLPDYARLRAAQNVRSEARARRQEEWVRANPLGEAASRLSLAAAFESEPPATEPRKAPALKTAAQVKAVAAAKARAAAIAKRVAGRR